MFQLYQAENVYSYFKCSKNIKNEIIGNHQKSHSLSVVLFFFNSSNVTVLCVCFISPSSNCVMLLTGWIWASYRALWAAGPSPVACWRKQLVEFYTFTKTLPHHYRTLHPFQQSMMPPRGFLGRKRTERCGRPGLMTQQKASPHC